MDALFWIGQVGWVAFLACGAYVSFCFADLADEDAARTATLLHATPSRPGQHFFPLLSEQGWRTQSAGVGGEMGRS